MIEIVVPRLDWSMDEGTFLGWLKPPGTYVRAGEPLFELEGEKAAQEIEALENGILHVPADAPQPGSIVAVGRRIGYLLAEGESTPQAAAVAGASERQPTPVLAFQVPVAASAARARPRNTASPRARRVAAELGVDLAVLQGSSPGGRTRERDVRAAAGSAPTPTVSPPAAATAAGRHLPITPRRRTIAQRMLTSSRHTAPVTLTTRADATNLVALRRQFQAAGSTGVPTYSDIITKLAAIALQQHPVLGARWHEDRIELPEHTHIGIAVDTEEGLLVPVIRDVDRLSLNALAQQARQLIERARQRQLTAEQLHGGVFTITNLGSFGIDAFTPILKPPESAILGVGAIRRVAVALADDTVAARDQITLSLTFDHRVVDGAPAARFLQALVQGIENPAAWLLG